MKKFEVTIRCTSYNQVDYILDALKSFVMQETTFPFLILIVDDASTDGTAQIIRQYVEDEFDKRESQNSWPESKEYYDDIFAQHHVNKNCYILSMNLKQNMYHDQLKKQSLFAPWIQCSKYIAMCDGDDYWIDRHKLQKQVDFLESHSDYQLIFHNAICHQQDGSQPDWIMCQFPTGDFGLKEVFEYWQLPYASVLVRETIYEHPAYKELIKKVQGGWCWFIIAAQVGKVYGVSECMSVYRKNAGGVSNGMSLDFVIEANYKFAYAVGVDVAINAIDNKVRDILVRHYREYLKGNPCVKKAMETAMKYNRRMSMYVLWDYIKHLPKALFVKLTSKEPK